MDEITLCWLVRESSGLIVDGCTAPTTVAKWTDYVGWQVTLMAADGRSWILDFEDPDPAWSDVQAVVERAMYGKALADFG